MDADKRRRKALFLRKPICLLRASVVKETCRKMKPISVSVEEMYGQSQKSYEDFIEDKDSLILLACRTVVMANTFGHNKNTVLHICHSERVFSITSLWQRASEEYRFPPNRELLK